MEAAAAAKAEGEAKPAEAAMGPAKTNEEPYSHVTEACKYSLLVFRVESKLEGFFHSTGPG